MANSSKTVPGAVPFSGLGVRDSKKDSPTSVAKSSPVGKAPAGSLAKVDASNPNPDFDKKILTAQPKQKAAPEGSFSNAFAAARKEGKSVFTFNGKKYNTRRADDMPSSSVAKSAPPAKSYGRGNMVERMAGNNNPGKLTPTESERVADSVAGKVSKTIADTTNAAAKATTRARDTEIASRKTKTTPATPKEAKKLTLRESFAAVEAAKQKAIDKKIASKMSKNKQVAGK